MRSIGRIAVVFLALCLAAVAMPSNVQALTPSPIASPENLKSAEQVAKALWTQCLSEARQVVLYRDKWTCTDRASSEGLLPGLGASELNPDAACAPDNKRRMPTGVIPKIIEQIKNAQPKESGATAAIFKNGIRIVGAVFCQDEVNLSDLTLLYPLVLDRAVFKFGIRARNLNIDGNFSLDGSYIYDNLDISNSKIGGTIFGRRAFIQKLTISNSEVSGHLRLNDSVLLDYLALSRAKIGGGVDVTASKLSTIAIRESQIAQRLTLNRSEASCQYRIEKSELNEVLAIGAGFGTTLPAPKDRPQMTTTYRGWRPIQNAAADDRSAYAEISRVPAVKQHIGAPAECPTSTAQLSIWDSTVRSICIQNFSWIAPSSGNPVAPAALSFNALTANNLTLDLWPAKADDSAPAERTIEIVGAKIATFAYDFSDTHRRYSTLIDRVSIDQVYNTKGNCGTQSNEASLTVPDTTQAKNWLAKNSKKSTLQPYVAFIKAYENTGADATELKIAKANLQFKNDLESKWRELVLAVNGGDWSDIVSIKQPIDALRLSINSIGGSVADFGFRPYKSLIYIAMAIAAFYLVIRYWLRITYAKSEIKTELVPVNVYSIIDWMIPVYNLDPAHYKISGYYFKNASPVDAATERRMSQVMLAIRICGILAAVFLTATLKVFVLD